MKRRFIFISVLLLCFSAICSGACIDEIKTFYASYMTNILNVDSTNEALCRKYLTEELAAKLQRMRNATGGDPIIRAQDMNSDAIKTLNVREIADDWYIVKRGDMMSADDVVDILAVPLIGIVPDDENVVIATNQGEPLVGSDTPAGKAYRNVVDRVLGKEIPFLDFEKGVSFWTKVTGIFRKA